MKGPAPVAVGYVCGRDGEGQDRQRAAVEEYARQEGLALAQVVTDRFDTVTISQIVQTARLHDAHLVIVPTSAHLAAVQARVRGELEPHGASCVLIGDPGTHPAHLGSRLTDRARRHTTAANGTRR